MMNRLNLGFYSHINIDQHLEVQPNLQEQTSLVVARQENILELPFTAIMFFLRNFN